MLRRIAIVGASLAGLRAAETLRDRGFDGELTLIGDEPHRPYDRPPLSKQVLQGAWEPEQTFFRKKDGYDALALDMRLGVRALSVDLRARRVALADGTFADYDRLIIATGARVRTLPAIAPRAGLLALRGLDDAIVLRRALMDAPHVAIVGAGFIGLEVAASCRARGLPVTVIETLPVPLSPILGPTFGDMVAAMHRDHGVDLRTGVVCDRHPRRVARRRSRALRRLTDRRRRGGCRHRRDSKHGMARSTAASRSTTASSATAPVKPHQMCMRPVTWPGSQTGGTATPRESSIGPTRSSKQCMRRRTRSRAPRRLRDFSSVPYFWSDQYDRKIQFIGAARPHDEMVIVDGSLADRRLTALYRRDDRVVACLAVNQPRALIKYRKLLAAGASWDAALSGTAAS